MNFKKRVKTALFALKTAIYAKWAKLPDPARRIVHTFWATFLATFLASVTGIISTALSTHHFSDATSAVVSLTIAAGSAAFTAARLAILSYIQSRL